MKNENRKEKKNTEKNKERLKMVNKTAIAILRFLLRIWF